MFTLEQVRNVQSRIRTGADFPAYIADLKTLGVIAYETFVHDGHTGMEGQAGHRVLIPGHPGTDRQVSENSNPTRFATRLALHQQGGTDYPTFCADCADCGVSGWRVDTAAMTCSYFDTARAILLVERIPDAPVE